VIPPVDIDVAYDFRTDSFGKDPDQHSATLRRYHQLLWSKPLPNGAPFDLSIATPNVYLHHKSELGEFFLASDTVTPTFRRWVRFAPILESIPEPDQDAFSLIGYTIAGMMIFPGNTIGGKQTINGARGFTRAIADRFDLTLECIRRFYLDEPSPLATTLLRYANFFGLFGDFRGYVDFFLLQDLVTDDYAAVRFFTPFANFTTSSVPSTLGEYVAYRTASISYLEARNRRIHEYGAAFK
jgi:hypothetical protein